MSRLKTLTAEYRELKARLEQGGGPDKVRRQHEQGKLTARERIETLLDQGALGMITTHDLALTSIADVFPRRIRNVHFQERLDAGKLSFDYCLREGIVTTSNGVELMKSIGLEV